MPPKLFALILVSVLVAGALTVWLISTAGPGALLVALPLFMIATVALRAPRK